MSYIQKIIESIADDELREQLRTLYAQWRNMRRTMNTVIEMLRRDRNFYVISVTFRTELQPLSWEEVMRLGLSKDVLMAIDGVFYCKDAYRPNVEPTASLLPSLQGIGSQQRTIPIIKKKAYELHEKLFTQLRQFNPAIPHKLIFIYAEHIQNSRAAHHLGRSVRSRMRRIG